MFYCRSGASVSSPNFDAVLTDKSILRPVSSIDKPHVDHHSSALSFFVERERESNFMRCQYYERISKSYAQLVPINGYLEEEILDINLTFSIICTKWLLSRLELTTA